MSIAGIIDGVIECLDRTPLHKNRNGAGLKTAGAMVRHRQCNVIYSGFINNPASGDREEILGTHLLAFEVAHTAFQSEKELLTKDIVEDMERLMLAVFESQLLNAQGIIQFDKWDIKKTKSGDYYMGILPFKILGTYAIDEIGRSSDL